MHLDLHVDSEEELQTELERLVGLGAMRVDWCYPAGAGFVVLADTEGNLFCVVTQVGQRTSADVRLRCCEHPRRHQRAAMHP